MTTPGFEASSDQVQALLAFMGSYEPVRYLCVGGCARQVAGPKSYCIRCGNESRTYERPALLLE